MRDATAFLREIPTFADLDSDVLDRLAEGGIFEEIPVDAVVFRQGDRPSFLYVLVRGMIALTSQADGTQTVVDILRPVDQFILAPVLLGAPYLVSAQALQPSQVLRIPAEVVRQVVESEPEAAVAAMRHVSRQYRSFVGEILDLKLRSAAQRLASYLVTLLGDQPGPTEIRLPYGKRHLAARLGATPEHLSRAFATLRKYGVETRGARVTIADAEKLALFAATNGMPKPDFTIAPVSEAHP